MSASSREKLDGYLFILPWILGFLFFTIGPMIASFYFSFTDYSLLEPSKWVGLDNYRKLFSADDKFGISLSVTFRYSLASVPLGMVLALTVAMLLNQRVPGMRFYRTAFYLPSLLGGVALTLIWMWIFSPAYGLLNTFLKMIGLEGPLWFQSQVWALPGLIIMSLWGVGGRMIIFLAGLQNIPGHLYEAAEMDGAGAMRRFWHVTVPMLTPTIFFNLVMGIIGSLQTFAQAFIATQGGPNNATLFYGLYLYQNAFQYFEMGYASALAWILFAIILALTLVVIRSSPMWVFYEGTLRK
ncbi:MAG: sugar ABC transporter permease [Anaerolineae bacterium]|nr:sugar ABC transporter permease [Anaerolineae bacterium]